MSSPVRFSPAGRVEAGIDRTGQARVRWNRDVRLWVGVSGPDCAVGTTTRNTFRARSPNEMVEA